MPAQRGEPVFKLGVLSPSYRPAPNAKPKALPPNPRAYKPAPRGVNKALALEANEGASNSWRNRKVMVGLDPKTYDPAAKVPSSLHQLAKLADNAGSWAGVGIKPSTLYHALGAAIHNPKQTFSKGYAPDETPVLPVWGGRVEQDILGHNYVMRPLGIGNTYEDRLKVMAKAVADARYNLRNHLDVPREQLPPKMVKHLDHYNFLNKLHTDMKKVNIQDIMKKQPWEMTRAEIMAHPYTVFHNSNSRPGLGNIGNGIHAGTLEAASDRKPLAFSGTKIHPMWMFPKSRKALGEAYSAHDEYAYIAPRRAPGRQVKPVRDSGMGTPATNAMKSFWANHFEGFPAQKVPPFTYQDNPAAVKGFFKGLKANPSPYDTAEEHMARNTDIFPYENNAEHPGSTSYEAHDPNVMKTHKQMIVEAAIAGHKIPNRVLREYPGIKRQIARYQKQGYAGNLLRDVYDKNLPPRVPGINAPYNKLDEYKRAADRIDLAFKNTEDRHVRQNRPDYIDPSMPHFDLAAHQSGLGPDPSLQILPPINHDILSGKDTGMYDMLHNHISDGILTYDDAKQDISDHYMEGNISTKQHNDLLQMAEMHLKPHQDNLQAMTHPELTNYAKAVTGLPHRQAAKLAAGYQDELKQAADELRIDLPPITTKPTQATMQADDMHYWHEKFITHPHDALEAAPFATIIGHDDPLEAKVQEWYGPNWKHLTDEKKIHEYKAYLAIKAKYHGINVHEPYKPLW